jgi:Rad3-related DNA helicase
VLDKIAGALEIESYLLFAVPPSPENTIEQLRQTLVTDIRQTIEEAVENAFAKREK